LNIYDTCCQGFGGDSAIPRMDLVGLRVCPNDLPAPSNALCTLTFIDFEYICFHSVSYIPGCRPNPFPFHTTRNATVHGPSAIITAHILTLFQDHIPFAHIPSCFVCVRSLVTLLQLSFRPRGHYYCSISFAFTRWVQLTVPRSSRRSRAM